MLGIDPSDPLQEKQVCLTPEPSLAGFDFLDSLVLKLKWLVGIQSAFSERSYLIMLLSIHLVRLQSGLARYLGWGGGQHLGSREPS